MSQKKLVREKKEKYRKRKKITKVNTARKKELIREKNNTQIQMEQRVAGGLSVTVRNKKSKMDFCVPKKNWDRPEWNAGCQLL